MEKYIVLVTVLIVVFLVSGCRDSKFDGISAPEKEIESIVDTAAEQGACFMCTEEVFYEDDNYVYTFGETPMSHYIIVKYTNGYEQNVKEALEDGNIEITDLDTYGIMYYADSKWGEDKTEFKVNTKAGIHTARVKITEWQSDGFWGVVTAYTRFDAYDIGTELFVKFDEDSFINLHTDAGAYAVEGIPASEKIPVGTEVYISFYQSRVSSETSESSGEIQIVVYAHEMTSEYFY